MLPDDSAIFYATFYFVETMLLFLKAMENASMKFRSLEPNQ